MNEVYKTNSVEETIICAEKFGQKLSTGDVVALYGQLGSGKTQFVKGICKAFNIDNSVTSPSFVIINRYSGLDKDGKSTLIFHIDLYRVKSQDELYNIGIEEFIGGNSICLIEWAEMLDKLLPNKRYDVRIEFGEEENQRQIIITRIG